MNFPALPGAPERPTDLMYAFNTATNRPLVWDENGMPLDSYYSEEEGYAPARNPDDYAHVDPVTYKPKLVTEKGFGMNLGLLAYIRPSLPEMTYLATDVARAYRTTRDIAEEVLLPVDEALTLAVGLNSLWALMMYRQNSRVPNGELPAHVANIHRTFVGYEGLFTRTIIGLGKLGVASSAVVLPPEALTQMAMGGLSSDFSGERCPAREQIIGNGMVALISAPEEAFDRLLPVIDRADNPRLLDELGIDDATFTHFALAMRQLMSTHNADDFAAVKQILQTA